MNTSLPQIVPANGDTVVTLSTDYVRPYERIDYWREMVCRTFAEVELTSRLSGAFWGNLDVRSWDNMRVSRVRTTAQSVQRMRRQPQSEEEDCYFAVLVLAGNEFLEQDGRQVLLQPGDIAVYDATRPHRLTLSQEFQKLIVHAPRTLLRERITGVEDCTAVRIRGTDGVGAITSSFLRSLAGNFSRLSPSQVATLSSQSLDLLAMALAEIRPVEAKFSRSRSLSRCRVKAFIEQNLANPDLDVDMVAGAVGLSPRYTNMLFEDESTSVMRYVWKRRIERCKEEMLDPAHNGCRVSEISLRWGFNDAAHFSRFFRQSFGVTPREYRNRGRVKKT